MSHHDLAMRFETLSDLTVPFLEAQGIKGVIFDLDDTLVVEHTGVLSQEVAQLLKTLDEHGIRLAIVSNNHFPNYCDRIIEQLRTLDIACLFVSNAYKPLPFAFYHVRSYFGLPFEAMLLVGDGVLTDHLAARLTKIQFAKSHWFVRPFYKQGILWVLREMIVLFADWFRYLFLGHRIRIHLLEPEQELEADKRAHSLEKRRYLFLVNPKSGKSNVPELEQEIVEIFKSSPYQHEVFLIKNIHKLQKQLGPKIQAGLYTHLVGIGGDGTVRQALQLIAANNPKVTLGIISSGTGNLIAKSLNLPLTLSEALDTVVNGKETPFSIMQVNQHFAALAVGMGVDAEVMAGTPTEAKKLFGPMAYVLSGIRVALFKRKTWFRLEIDGQRLMRKADGVFVIQRNQYAQAYIPVPLNYNEDQNNLDVCIVSATTHLDVLVLLQKLFAADYTDLDGLIEHYNCKQVRITGWPQTKVQIDGDLVKDKKIWARVLKDRLNVMVPA